MPFEMAQTGARVFVPDGVDAAEALARTTHLAIGAHADDVEFMAWAPIIHCHGRDDAWFTAVVVGDGRASPRDGAWTDRSDDEVRVLRLEEQWAAARLGGYSAAVCLDWPSASIRVPQEPHLRSDLSGVVRACAPREVYTHNLADRHETHAALAVAVIEALRSLDVHERPSRLYGGEVWGSLDWLTAGDKATFDVSHGVGLMERLMAVFASQIDAGKAYDVATLGRKRANATYLRSHETDGAAAMEYAIDMTALLDDASLSIPQFVRACVARFQDEIDARLSRYCSPWKS